MVPLGNASVELAMKQALQALPLQPSSDSGEREHCTKDQGKETQVCVEDLSDVAGGSQSVCS